MGASTAVSPGGVVLYDGQCGFCSRWVSYWAPTLRHAGFEIAALQGAGVSNTVDPNAPESWDFTLVLPDGRRFLGADAYRQVMRRIWWAYPLYLLSTIPGLRGLFNRAYRTFAQNRYCISGACRVDPPTGRETRNGTS